MIALIHVFCCIVYCFAHREILVYPRVVEERKTAATLVLRLNDEITLNLERSSVLAKNLLFVTSGNEGHHLSTIDTSSIQETLYHDPEWQSSVQVLRKDGAVQVEGIVNSKLRIKPLLESERSFQGELLHSVYEVDEIREDLSELGVGTTYGGRTLQRTLSSSSNLPHYPTTRTPRHVDNFTVELHIISDEYHQENFRTDQDLIVYLAVMTNAVNTRFLDMKGPSITFKLVGVTRSKDDKFASHIVGVIESKETLEGLVNYSRDGYIQGSFDILYLITGREIASIRDSGVVVKSVAGLAYVGKVCSSHGVAEGEDIAKSYEGVHTMAHELAHSLGAEHDPENNTDCSWFKGFLMSYIQNGTNKYRLSKCSENQIKHVVERLDDSCLQESADATLTSLYYDGKLPGQKIVENYYCRLLLKKNGMRKRVFTLKQFDNKSLSEVCKMMCCYKNDRSTLCMEVDMLDGMFCDEMYTKTCLRGECANHQEKSLRKVAQ